jgi:putative colanic acid biosynthesis acetyltransferase WcaB
MTVARKTTDLREVSDDPATTPCPQTMLAWVGQDWAVNPGRPDSRTVLLIFRLGQWCQLRWGTPGRLISVLCQVVCSLVFGVEIPSACAIGPGLRLYHPHSIVLNPSVRMGAGCHLRQNTTVGNVIDRDGVEGGSPTIGDGVELGAGCVVLGPVQVGAHARIGALAVVTKDVPAWGVVVGNPGRLIRVDVPGPSSD